MMYAIASLCDWFGAKRVAMRLFTAAPRSDYAAWWGAVGLMQTGRDEEALGFLTRVRAIHPGWKRTKRLLATLYLRRDLEKAVQLYSPPMGIWEEVFLGDLLYFFLHREDEGVQWWRQAYARVDWNTARELNNPARLLLKRLCRITSDPVLLERFAELDTDNFRQQDIVDYAEILASRGELDKAREMLDRGFYIYRGDPPLTACWERLGFGQLPPYKVKTSGTAPSCTGTAIQRRRRGRCRRTELAGTFRVFLGVGATALGKLLHRKGWFYAVVGPVAKAVDSDKVMPYDACLVPGPLDVETSIATLARKGAHISVVDVNDVFGAEIVASTEGVDEDWLRRSLEDNPAGNDDSMTPIVVVMPE